MGKLRENKICLRRFCVQKWVKVMRLTLILSVFLVFNTYASSNAQQISLNVDNQAIEMVFRTIEKQTGYKFFSIMICLMRMRRYLFL